MDSGAAEFVSELIADIVEPPPDLKIAEWGNGNIKIIDGPYAGDDFNSDFFPVVNHIFEWMHPDHPANVVTVRKSVQSTLTTVLMVIAGFWIVNTPCNILLVQPTDGDANEFNRGKFQPTIEACDALKKRVSEDNTSGKSTVRTKVYPGGFLFLTGANSPSNLSSKTIKLALCDEVDQWPDDVGGQGDPEELVDGRQTAFVATGDWKKFRIGTPTVKGASRIDRGFHEGTQTYVHIPCPSKGDGCDHDLRMEFNREIFKFNTVEPYQAHFVCPECGTIIEEHYVRRVLREQKYILVSDNPTARNPSIHVDRFISPLVTFDRIVDKFLKAGDDPRKLMTFYNLMLGLPFEVKGSAPPWKEIYARREDYRIGSIPYGGLFLTLAVDVQKDGLFYEVVAWGMGKQNWSIDHGFLEGETADINNKVWKDLDLVYHRKYEDSYGNLWGLDLVGVDSGYNTTTVYKWCNKRPLARAIKGLDGWGRPPYLTPSDVETTYKGKKKKKGAKVWGIGTWGLKAELYAYLELDDPTSPGYCHFSEFHDEAYFKQLTAEFLKEVTRRGKPTREWFTAGRANHYHDCRIYNMALAEMLGITRMNASDWRQLAKKRNQSSEQQTDLFYAAQKLDQTAEETTAIDENIKVGPRRRKVRSRGI